MIKIERCEKKDISLFHITNKDAVSSISQKGLRVEDADLEGLVELHYDFMQYDDPTYTREQARKEVFPMIFATDEEGVEHLIEKGSAIIGIKYTERGKCADLFWKDEIASFHDYISSENIPPECLCVIETWE